MPQKTPNFIQDIIESCASCPPLRTAVVHPVTDHTIEAVNLAVKAKLIEPVLIGPKARIAKAAKEAKIDIKKWELIDCEHSHDAASRACKMAGEREVNALMKGSLHSSEYLGALLKTRSLQTERRISHAYLMHVETYHKPFIVTDAAINILPELAIKADIVQNAINLWHAIYGKRKTPKVALLGAVEMVNAAMPSTIDSAALCKMADRGQITGGELDGPLAFDNAFSKEAAKEKGIKSKVAGDADIFVAPDLEAANIMGKQLTFTAKAEAAGVVLGARVPVILTSRADNVETKLLSCALAVKLAEARAKGLFL